MNKFKHTSLNWASQNENASINPTTKHSFCSFPSCVERDGIIESRRGVGMFVSPSAAAPRPRRHRIRLRPRLAIAAIRSKVMTSTDFAITTHNLSRRFGTRKAADNLNLAVPQAPSMGLRIRRRHSGRASPPNTLSIRQPSARKQSRVPAPLPLIPVIAGPTAGGKSALAVELAHSLASQGQPAELITADAFQIYKGMDIGTAKPSIAERQGIPHHLLDLRDPRDPTPFTVHDWLREAQRAIADIQTRYKTPIVVGGTHLYIKSLLDGLFEGPGADHALRDQLRAKGLPTLREELERIDPDAAQRIHANDERRTIRALEVFHLTGKPISAHQTQWDAPQSDIPNPKSEIPHSLIILDWPAELINPRINARVKQMMEAGFLDEVRTLHASGAFAPTANTQAREALGYKQLLAHVEGRMSLDDAVERIKIDTRHFAKTQRTWLKRLRTTPGCKCIDAEATTTAQQVTLVISAMAVTNAE